MTTLAQAIASAAGAIQRRTREWPATLSSATGDVTPNRDATVYSSPGFVYCVMPDGAIAKAYNNRVPPTTGLRVWVGYEPRNRALLRVLDFNYSYTSLGGFGGGAGSGIGPHHKTHEWLNPGGGNDAVFSQARQLMPLRVSPVSAFVIRVENSPAAVGTAWAPSDTGTLDLVGDKPATGALYVLIYLDAAGTLSKRVGSNVGAFVSLDYTDIPALGAGETALAAVALYQGQTAIQETQAAQDIVDLRFSNFGGGGAETFLELTDTPASYTGAAGSVPAVNVSEDALEFVASVDIGDDAAEIDSVNFLERGTDAATPTTGHWRLYAKSGGLYVVDDAGGVIGPLSDGTGSGTVTSVGTGELLMMDGTTSPPVPIETEDGADWLYADP